MDGRPIVIHPEGPGEGATAKGTTLVVGNWPAAGTRTEVAPLHVHHEDDEAWHVIEGAIRFRFGEEELIATAGTTVIVPKGTPHTFGNAGPEPSRYLIVMPARLSDLVGELHRTPRDEHASVYAKYRSALLE